MARYLPPELDHLLCCELCEVIKEEIGGLATAFVDIRQRCLVMRTTIINSFIEIPFDHIYHYVDRNSSTPVAEQILSAIKTIAGSRYWLERIQIEHSFIGRTMALRKWYPHYEDWAYLQPKASP